MQPISKNALLLIVIVIGAAIFFNMANSPKNDQEIPFSQFLNLIESGEVTDVIIRGNRVSGKTGNGSYFVTNTPRYYESMVQQLFDHGVRFRVEPRQSNSLFFAFLTSWLPIILIVAVWVFFMKQMQGGSRGIMGFGKSKPKKMEEEAPKVKFDDVAGIDESKAELSEIVDFLKNPGKFEKLGGKIPTGVLLVGEPGTGKTLLARAIAGEAEVAFFSISGSDFVEMFVGVGASRVRDLFSQARASAPCIIFIDEIDAVGRHRGAGLGGGNDEREQTLNQLLVEMDGFEENPGVIVVAATNRPDVLDSALTRPGRFDRQVVVPRPDMRGREKILQVHTKPLILSDDVDLPKIARATSGFTGADLANLANESAINAARLNKDQVEMQDFEDSRDKVMMGKERRSMVVTEDEKRTTAFHEAGHAIVATLLDEVDPVHKVTIIPRGQALGLTMLIPEEDQHSMMRSKLLANLKMIMGGRAAEELIFNHYTTGAGNDLERATSLAHQMVCNWGMSEEIGPVHLAVGQGQVFLGKDLMRKKRTSQISANIIDKEVNRIVNQAYQDSLSLLRENMEILKKVTQDLIENETIEGSSILKYFKHEPETAS